MTRIILPYDHLGPVNIPEYSKTLLKKGFVEFANVVQKMNPQIVIDWFVMSEVWAEWLATKHLQVANPIPNSHQNNHPKNGREIQAQPEMKFGGFGIPTSSTIPNVRPRPVPSIFQQEQGTGNHAFLPVHHLPAHPLPARPPPAFRGLHMMNQHTNAFGRPQSIFKTQPPKNRIEDHQKAIKNGDLEMDQALNSWSEDHQKAIKNGDLEMDQALNGWSEDDDSVEFILSKRLPYNDNNGRRFGPSPSTIFTPPKFLDHLTKLWSTSAAALNDRYRSIGFSPPCGADRNTGVQDLENQGPQGSKRKYGDGDLDDGSRDVSGDMRRGGNGQSNELSNGAGWNTSIEPTFKHQRVD